MKLLELELRNFMSYQHEVIDFSNLTVTAIIGENGVGKSSLIEAVTFALFGQSRAKSDDELSFSYNNQEKKWEVENFFVKLKYEINGLKYQIVRSKSPSGTSLKFGKGDEFDLTGNTIKDTEKSIQISIGMDYDSFVASVVLKQNEYDALMEMSPSESKRVLMKIIGLDDFEVRAEKVKKLGNEIEIEYGVVLSRIDTIKDELTKIQNIDKELEFKTDELKNFKISLQEIESVLERAQKEYHEVKSKYDKQSENAQRIIEIQDELTVLSKKTRSVENEFDELLTKAGGDWKKIQDNRDKFVQWKATTSSKKLELQKQLDETREKIGEIKQEVKQHKNRVSELESNTQVCLMANDECNISWRKKLTEEVQKKNKILIQLQENDLEDQVTYQSQFESEINEQIGKEKRLDNGMLAISKYDQLSTLKESLKKIQKEKENLEGVDVENQVTDEDVRGYELQIRKRKEQKVRTTEQIEQLSSEIGSLKNSKDRQEKLSEELDSKRIEKKKLVDRKLVYEILYKAFSKDGIPALMIEKVVPVLEIEANNVLEKLTNGRISVEFRLQKKLKGGGFSDSFEIFVTDDKGTRSVRMYSGGEKFRVIFAIHFSFSFYLTRRSGSRIRFIAIDEPAGLDDNGIEKLVEMLSLMKKNYDQIFVISHLKNLIDSFPQTILIEKGLTGSKVRTGKNNSLEEML